MPIAATFSDIKDLIEVTLHLQRDALHIHIGLALFLCIAALVSSPGRCRVAFGWLLSVMTLVEALGSAYPEKLQRWMKDRTAVSFTTFVMALSLIVIPFVGQVGVVFALIIFSVASGLSFPIQKQLMNYAIVVAP